MNIAIVVITHKKAAKALIESAEMICGKQENIISVDFLENEDMPGLIEKCREKMKKLDMQDGVLFMVDLFGGTPFNAAYTIAKENPNYAVISGVNMPMLVEAFVSRADMGLEELCRAIRETAVEGIRIAEYIDSKDENDE